MGEQNGSEAKALTKLWHPSRSKRLLFWEE